jgi:hypothetical protein
MKNKNQFHGIQYLTVSDVDDQDGNLYLPVSDGNSIMLGGMGQPPKNSTLTEFDGVSFAFSKEIVGFGNPTKTRGFDEIVEALHGISNLTWYDAHLNMRQLVEQGTLQIVDTPTFKPGLNVNHEDWEGDLDFAREIESEYGLEEGSEPLSGVELGVMLGKLSALRWVMGVEWDTLDT